MPAPRGRVCADEGIHRHVVAVTAAARDGGLRQWNARRCAQEKALFVRIGRIQTAGALPVALYFNGTVFIWMICGISRYVPGFESTITYR